MYWRSCINCQFYHFRSSLGLNLLQLFNGGKKYDRHDELKQTESYSSLSNGNATRPQAQGYIWYLVSLQWASLTQREAIKKTTKPGGILCLNFFFLKLTKRGYLGTANTEERAGNQGGCPAPTSLEMGWLWYSLGTQQTVLRLKACYSPWPFPSHLSSEKSSLLLLPSQWQAIPSKTKGQVVGWHKVNMGDLSAFGHAA